MFRGVLIALAILALSGCKLHVIALLGGEVRSTSSGTCPEQTNCVHDITDTSYTELFEAVPSVGYEFVKWHGDNAFLCKNSTNTVCPVDTTLLAGEVPDAAIAAFSDVYIMPIFQALPFVGDYSVGGAANNLIINDTVTVYDADNDVSTIVTGIGSPIVWAFPVGWADGFSYNMSIQTQPILQTCSISNGSGTVSGADVTNIDINCGPNEYLGCDDDSDCPAGTYCSQFGACAID